MRPPSIDDDIIRFIVDIELALNDSNKSRLSLIPCSNRLLIASDVSNNARFVVVTVFMKVPPECWPRWVRLNLDLLRRLGRSISNSAAARFPSRYVRASSDQRNAAWRARCVARPVRSCPALPAHSLAPDHRDCR